MSYRLLLSTLKKKKKHEAELTVLKKKQNRLGWLRLGIIVIAAVIAFYFFTSSLVFGWLAVITGIGFFPGHSFC